MPLRLLFLLIFAHSASGADQPRYELRLSRSEYSCFHSAVENGVISYGGDAEYKVRFGSANSNLTTEPTWFVTISNPKLMDALSIWMAEQAASLITVIDVDNLDANAKLAISSVRSVIAKLSQSRSNPIWDTKVVSAVVKESGNDVGLIIDRKFFIATGTDNESLRRHLDRAVIARGFSKDEGYFNVQSIVPKKDNTIELVVLSRCPFGVSSGKALIERVRSQSSKSLQESGVPSLEFRYLFYRKPGNLNPGNGDSAQKWTCLHGDSELKENLVQMVLRDHLSGFFDKYFLARAADSAAEWKSLAAAVGMSREDIDFVERTIDTDRDRLIEAEYDYVSKTLGVVDGSPTFIWESQRVPSLASIPGLADLKIDDAGACAGTTK